MNIECPIDGGERRETLRQSFLLFLSFFLPSRSSHHHRSTRVILSLPELITSITLDFMFLPSSLSECLPRPCYSIDRMCWVEANALSSEFRLADCGGRVCIDRLGKCLGLVSGRSYSFWPTAPSSAHRHRRWCSFANGMGRWHRFEHHHQSARRNQSRSIEIFCSSRVLHCCLF